MRSDYRKRCYVFFSLLIMVIVIFSMSKINYGISKELVLKKAPQFTLNDINGKSIKLTNYLGKVVIIDFFATWCPPCKSEVPHFVDLQNKYAKKGFFMLGICLDADNKGNVKQFIKKYKINYPILVVNDLVKKSYGGIRAIPTTFVINKKGQIYKEYVGYRDKNIFESDIQSIIK